MTVNLTLEPNDVEELQQLLGRDDLPVDHWPLADRLIDQLEAAIDEAKPRSTLDRWLRPLEEMGGYHHDG